MSSRGRGYGGYNTRGSYNGRGSGYRGSYRGGRGSYEGRGGRGGYSSNYDSRYNNSGGNRYTSNRDRIDDSYKKPYRSESTTSYSTRDYGGRSGSPERKRMRMESYVQGSSDRRSHDGGGHYYSSRQESYPSERRSFGEDRRRSPSRETREYRKSGGMGPPRSPARMGAPRSRVARAPRRSFRGRSLRTRGSYRGTLRSRGSFPTRRYGDRSLAYTRPFRTLKGRSASIKSKEEASSTEDEWDADEKDEEEEAIEEKKEAKAKSPKVEPDVEDAEVAAAEGEETDKEGVDAASDEVERPQRRATARPYVHLSCIHCKEKYATFAGYTKHLMSGKHRAAMGSVARRHKAQLLRMRVAQRGAQRDLEAAAGADLAARTTFCLVCRLNHRTTRHSHNLTDTHRAMKRFLMPFCRVCRIAFRSPMIYEHHICSLEHLKRKATQATRRPSSPKADASGDEGMDVDLENFMTLDSVGDVDEVDDEDSGGEKKEETAEKKPKVEINIGSEHIKKLEVWWCELCRVYLPRAGGAGEQAEALRRHCRLRLHLGRYVQHRDTRTLRKHAERIHRQLHQAKEGEKDGANDETTDKNSEKSVEVKLENGADPANASGNEGEDKLWADVDKDIGELLAEVDPRGNDGSDDEEDLGRYDKFRKSDKSKTVVTEGEETENNAAENSSEKPTDEVTAPA